MFVAESFPMYSGNTRRPGSRSAVTLTPWQDCQKRKVIRVGSLMVTRQSVLRPVLLSFPSPTGASRRARQAPLKIPGHWLKMTQGQSGIKAWAPRTCHASSISPSKGTRISPAEMLVDQLKRELKLPRCACGAADEAEARSAKEILRHSKVNDIEQVEELGAELHRQRLTSSSFTE